jgi:hypothetical protein
MTTPEERALFAAGDAVIPDHFEQKLASRLASSLRDEAIWQYHLGRQRGVVLWCADHSFRYVRRTQWTKLIRLTGDGLSELPPVLTDYDPVKEALVMTRTVECIELHRIGDDGVWTLAWQTSSKPSPASHSESEPSPATQSE